MKRIRILSLIAFAFVTALFAGTPAFAQASRTWVSGVGSDTNPCSRTAPCKTFAAAYSLTAAGGEIDALDGAGYGTLTIAKSITIDGGGGQVASVLASGTNGMTISGAGIVVTLRNLNFNGIGAGLAGISFVNGAQLSVINCEIQGFNQEGLIFQPSATGARLIVKGLTVHDNPGYGIAVAPSITSGSPIVASLDDVTSFHNGIGLAAFDNTEVQVTRSNISGNTAVGAESLSNTVATILSFEESTVSNNTGNGLSTFGTGNPIIRMSNMFIFGNTGSSMLISAGGHVVSFGNNRITDNGTNTSPNGSFLQQ